jgi:hypothetical protein
LRSRTTSNAGTPSAPPEDPQSAANLLRTAVTTGFYTIVAELLRAGGWDPSELAAALNLARSRNRDDIADLILDHTTHSPAEGLSRRTQRCLTAAGIPLDKQAVLQALRTGALSWGTPCYGKKTHLDVCAWLDISQFLYMANCHLSSDWQFKQSVAVALPSVILKAGGLRGWAARFLPGRVAG